MNKIKLFLENFLIYGLGGIFSKAIPLIMVPIVIRLMPNPSYYGINEMQNTLCSFCGFLAVMGMYDAMFRMFFEKSETSYKADICSTTLIFTVCMSTVIAVLLIILHEPIAKVFFNDSALTYLVDLAALTVFVNSTKLIVAAPTRMQNQRRVFLVMNTAGPLLAYGVSVPLLLHGYYIIALPLGALLSGISVELVFWQLNRHWFSLRRFNVRYLKQLLPLAIPLIPNFLAYWIFNSSDRVMITSILDTSETGLYSVGAKLGMASQLIYLAFAGGWQYFSFSTMKEENQVKNNSLVFEYMGIISFASTTVICWIACPVYNFIFIGDYVDSFIISPYLFLAPLLQMLFQIEATQFMVVKKTWPIMFILFAGAVVNVILNLHLIPLIGIEGAAVATLSGYIVSDIICTAALIKMKLMVVSNEFLLSVVMMVAFLLVWRFVVIDSLELSLITSFLFIGTWGYLYRKPLQYLKVLAGKQN